MTESFMFNAKTVGDKQILFFKQGEVYKEKDITGTPVPENDQLRFQFLYQMLVNEGWVPDLKASLVT